ncbi:MAG: CCA tRNA nucleotidyltransferase [bacterium]
MSGGEPAIALRDAACAVALGLVRAGHQAYFAGGCVRDRLLARPVKDYDIATSARPDEVKAVYPKARGVGEAFGVMLVRHGGHTFEVATFREDGPYQDGRRPSEVTYSTAERDAARRDFTINGLFEDPATGETIDFVKGASDIAARLVRAIGDPHERIREDRLRMLRAARFAARLGFEIESRTFDAIASHAGELASVSAERVGEEIREMLAHSNRARAADLVEALGLDGAVVGHRGARSGRRLEALPAEVPVGGWSTALAAWWLDRCGAACEVGARQNAVSELRRRLVLSNDETDALGHALAIREVLLDGFGRLGVAARARMIARHGFDAAVALVRAEDAALGAEFAGQADRELPSRALPHPLLDGAVLIAAGYRPGPRFKEWIDLAMDAQLEGRIGSTADALALVRDAENRA